MKFRKTDIIVIIILIAALISYSSCERNQTKEDNMMKYTRVYSDENGESHFEDIEIELLPVDFAPPAPPINLSGFTSAKQFCFVNVSPGWSGDWHPTPKRQIFFYLSGTIEAEVSDGEIRRFGPGSVTLVEDTTGKCHRSRVVGKDEVFGVIIQLDN